ncbi:MAG: AAA domain-containing protein, partial [Deltaproteobacteria bacterium]|nr:AAA domain-containing protein [Deltaproteobacteria bacterium]
RALARATGGVFKRVQFTADLLPSDITGVNVYSAQTERFVFHPGPIFANVVLADEINRASPRTQSALLEAMSEGQVTTDDATRRLSSPFLVIATQNPHEHHGTYPLPESQMDRFLLRLTIGYPDREVERRIVELQGFADKVDEMVRAVASPEEVEAAQKAVSGVAVSESVMDYALELVSQTRSSALLETGISTRGAVSLVAAARGAAAIRSRDYCIPDDIRDVFEPVCGHRVFVKGRGLSGATAREEATAVLSEILARTPVPGD